MYRSIDVWKRIDPQTAVRYRCFEIFSTTRCCLQSSDFYRLPTSEESRVSADRQFIELLIEESLVERARTYSSLEEAILAHDREFENGGSEVG